MTPWVLGLTGGIGSGKTTVAALFSKRGIPIIDTDQLAREITEPGQPALKEIVDHFGVKILEQDHTLNRSKLRKIIFENPTERQWLEKLLHPLIRAQMQEKIQQYSSPYCIVVIPLLFETTPNPLIKRVLVVDASPLQQVERTIARDQVSREHVEAILKTQLSREEKLKKADDIIYNDGDLKHLETQVEKLHKMYCDNIVS